MRTATLYMPRILALAASLAGAACAANAPHLFMTVSDADHACGTDEVVLFVGVKGLNAYVTKESAYFGPNGNTWRFYSGYLHDMRRLGITCGEFHDPDDGPLPRALAPSCWNVPDQPKI